MQRKGPGAVCAPQPGGGAPPAFSEGRCGAGLASDIGAAAFCAEGAVQVGAALSAAVAYRVEATVSPTRVDCRRAGSEGAPGG